jgi:hypothetical protein
VNQLPAQFAVFGNEKSFLRSGVTITNKPGLKAVMFGLTLGIPLYTAHAQDAEEGIVDKPLATIQGGDPRRPYRHTQYQAFRRRHGDPARRVRKRVRARL